MLGFFVALEDPWSTLLIKTGTIELLQKKKRNKKISPKDYHNQYPNIFTEDVFVLFYKQINFNQYPS